MNKRDPKTYLFAFIFICQSIVLYGQNGGLQGIVKDQAGNGLGFATIYIRNIETGTTTNSEGYYQIKLDPGNYDIVFQYLGYETDVRFIQVNNKMQNLDITLQAVTFTLSEFVVDSDKEDPAYTIMRKAIAKSDYHRQQLDSYSATVYIKGSGRLLDSPFFCEK